MLTHTIANVTQEHWIANWPEHKLIQLVTGTWLVVDHNNSIQYNLGKRNLSATLNPLAAERDDQDTLEWFMQLQFAVKSGAPDYQFNIDASKIW